MDGNSGVLAEAEISKKQEKANKLPPEQRAIAQRVVDTLRKKAKEKNLIKQYLASGSEGAVCYSNSRVGDSAVSCADLLAVVSQPAGGIIQKTSEILECVSLAESTDRRSYYLKNTLTGNVFTQFGALLRQPQGDKSYCERNFKAPAKNDLTCFLNTHSDTTMLLRVSDFKVLSSNFEFQDECTHQTLAGSQPNMVCIRDGAGKFKKVAINNEQPLETDWYRNLDDCYGYKLSPSGPTPFEIEEAKRHHERRQRVLGCLDRCAEDREKRYAVCDKMDAEARSLSDRDKAIKCKQDVNAMPRCADICKKSEN